VFALFAALPVFAQLTPENLRCENLENPLGVDAAQPRFGWTLRAANPAERGQTQAAWQILVARSPELLAADKGDVWDSGRVADSAQNYIALPDGVALDSGVTYHWKARAWDNAGRLSPWSAPAAWTTGILDPAHWSGAKWVGQPEPSHNGIQDAKSGPLKKTHWLRKNITLGNPPAGATVHVASFGYHELYVNGERAGDSVLDPAVSNLLRRVYYRTYDVSKHLKPGKNTFALWLGHGWTAWGFWNNYGMNPASPVKHGPAALAVVRGGGKTLAVTDETWKTRPANLAALNQWFWHGFGGEEYDASQALPEWNSAGYDDSAWSAARVVAAEPVKLSAHLVQPNRVIREFKPLSVEKSAGVAEGWLVDFGQNYNGWVRVPLAGAAGTKVTLHYSERYDPAKPKKEISSFGQEDHVILSGDPAKDVFENRFNYHQFRWLTIEGAVQKPDPAQITAKQIRSDYAGAAAFESSDATLNKLFALVRHTYECLTLGGYIVDCSHRERGGYGAEGQASVDAGLYNFDQAALLRKWAGDWRDMLRDNGDLPHCAPTYWGGGGPAWKLASVNIPWAAYTHYGDKRVLEENYAMMGAHLDFLQREIEGNGDKIYPNRAGRNDTWTYIGDWLPVNRSVSHNPRARRFFTSCFIVLSLDNMSAAAAALGREADAAKYAARAKALREAVHAVFYDEAKGCYVRADQTYLALALLAKIPPAELRPGIEALLENDIRVVQNGHISSGVLGTWLQLKYLTQARRSDLVHLMATQPERPGWGHFLARGDTTVPEDWNPKSPSPGAGSLAHSSFLSIGAWFIEGLAGIRVDPANAGFGHFHVAPDGVKQLDWVKASHRSVRGTIEVRWERAGGKFHLHVAVPPNTTATVRIPTDNPVAATENGIPLAKASGVTLLPPEKTAAVVKVASGVYHFEAPSPR
jgi:alpha-L-rhamnosidase